jgi:hypothetical protein
MSSAARDPARPVRLMLDAGVIIEGCLTPWGPSKAVLVLATVRGLYSVVLAEAIEREVQRAVARKIAQLGPAEAQAAMWNVSSWLDRVRIERHPLPTPEIIRQHAPAILPAIRHVNDLPAVVTAILARPDWVISTNVEHWNERLAARTGLRVASPLAFLRQLRPIEQQGDLPVKPSEPDQ